MSFGIPLFEAVSGTGNTTNALILESVVLIAYTFSVWFFASYISTRVEWVWTSEFTYGTPHRSGVLAFHEIRFLAA